MAIQFIIDSASDFNYHEAEKLGLYFVPLSVVWEGKEYRDQIDLEPLRFYERLIEESTLPTTCQVTPFVYSQAIENLVKNGDQVIIITLSSKLSGTYQSAVIAADDYPGQAYVVDSLNATIGEQILIRYALELRAQGLEAEKIVEELNQAKNRIRLIALVDTLEYLNRGGRISAVTAFAGSVLSIKPVIALENGAVEVVGKARGSKKANNLLTELIQRSGGVDFSKPYALGYSGLNDAMLQKYVEDSAALWKGHTDYLPVIPIGSVIGTHAGPGAVGVAFFSHE